MNTPFNTRIFSLIARYYTSTIEELLLLRLISQYTLEVMDGDRVIDMISKVLSQYKPKRLVTNEYILKRALESFRMYNISNRNILLEYFMRNKDETTDNLFIKLGFVDYSVGCVPLKDTALTYSIRCGQYERALRLIQAGSSIAYSGTDTLIDTVLKSSYKMNTDEYKLLLNTLVERGERPTNIHHRILDRETSLFMMGYFFDSGLADVNDRLFGGESYLTSVVKEDPSYFTAKFLLDRGANVNHTNDKGENALTISFNGRYTNIHTIHLLIERGCEIQQTIVNPILKLLNISCRNEKEEMKLTEVISLIEQYDKFLPPDATDI